MLQKFKRTLTFFLVITTIVSSFTVAFATDGDGETDPTPTPAPVSLVVDSISATQGDEAVVHVSIENNPGFHSFSYVLTYDKNRLTPSSPTTSLAGSLESKINTEGETSQIEVTYVSDNADANTTHNGALFTVKFKVGKEVSTGNIPLTITGTMTNIANEEVSLEITNGKIEIVPQEYTVTVENDGSGNAFAAQKTYHYGDKVELTAEPNLNCTFKTWLSAEGILFENASSEKTSFTMPAKDVTIYASFIDNAIISRNVVAVCTPENGGTISFDKESYSVKENVHVTAVPKDGYYFKEWESDDILIADKNIPNLDFAMLAKDVTITAVFEELLTNRYSMTANTTVGGTVSCNDNYFRAGASVKLSASPNTNYAFKEWKLDSDSVYIADVTDPVIEFSMPSENIEITAVFEYNPGKVYSVHLQTLGGGTAETDKQEYSAGDRVVITATPRLGYIFYGWESPDSITFLNPSALQTSFIMPARNVDITANFVVNPNIGGGGSGGSSGGGSGGGSHGGGLPTNNIFTIHFDSQGGSPVSSVTVYRGGLLSAPISPVRSGYEFDGWYIQSNCIDAYNFSNAVTQSFTLYARWLPLEGNEHFKDVKRTDWFYNAVHTLTQSGIINGMTPDMFMPNDNVTRAQFAQMLALASGADLSKYSCTFDDVSADDWYYPAISWANSVGVVNGVSKTSFNPTAAINRQDMAVMVWRYMEKILKISPKTTAITIPFSDDASISEHAKEAVKETRKYAVINGVSDNLFAPLANTNRAQAAKVVYTLLQFKK